jgi:hypothetical protein
MTGEFEICDLRVAGAPSAPSVGGSGVHIIGGQDLSIRNVSFVDCYDAITLEGPGCTQATMENIKINSGPTTHGRISLTRCSVINCRGISMVTGNQTIPTPWLTLGTGLDTINFDQVTVAPGDPDCGSAPCVLIQNTPDARGEQVSWAPRWIRFTNCSFEGGFYESPKKAVRSAMPPVSTSLTVLRIL